MSHPYPDVPIADPRETLDMLFAIAPNLLNQVNRIGGQNVPVYDQEVGYDDVFRNTGAYPEWLNQVLGLVAGVGEPGPGEVGQVARLAGDSLPALMGLLGPLMRTGRPVRSFHVPTAVAEGTVPVSRIRDLPGFADENLRIYQTGNPLDDARVARMVEHMREAGPEGIRPVELSGYAPGYRGPNPDQQSLEYIKDGNTRVAAAAHLGWNEIPAEVTYHGGAEDDPMGGLIDLINGLIRRAPGGGGGR